MMQRKMAWVGIPWLMGLWLSTSFSSSVTMCLLPAALLLLGAFRLLRRISTRQLIVTAIPFFMSVGMVFLYTQHVYNPVMAHTGVPEVFVGRVVALREYDSGFAQYQMQGSFSDGITGKVLFYGDSLGAHLGDDMEVTGTFSQPEENFLWNGKAYYGSQSIFLEADEDATARCIPADRWILLRKLRAYRMYISQKIQTYAGEEAGGLTSAMLLGTKDTLSEETEAVFTRSGIRHVVVISGLHVVLICAIWTWLSRLLHMGRRSRFLALTVLLLLYAAMVEMPVSILRAGLMFLLAQSAPLFYRKGDTLTSLCFAGILLTIRNPYLIQNVSFQLSFLGTFGIGVFAPWMTKAMPEKNPFQRLCKTMASLLCVSVCVFPVMLVYFREVSVASPLANLILVPICSLMVMLAMGIFLTGGAFFISKPIGLLLKLLYQLIMLLAHGLEKLIPVMFPAGWDFLPVLTAILAAVVLLIFLVYRKPRHVALALIVSFGILTGGQTVYQMQENQSFTVTLMGQGDAVTAVIAFQGKTDVIDLSGYRRNAPYVSAYLEDHGISRINTLCLTRRADDLFEAYGSALRYISVEEMAVPENCTLSASAKFSFDKLVQTDAFVIEDILYRTEVENHLLKITYGTLHFCIGASMKEIPEGEWNAVICSSWKGKETLPAGVYLKEEVTQLRVTSDGKITIIQEA